MDIRFRHAMISSVFLAAFSATSAQAFPVLIGSLGAVSRDHFQGGRFAWSAGLLFKFDEQILLGAQSGQGTVGAPGSIPALGSLMVRLPLGRIVLPVAVGDVGYAFSDNPGFLWRGGGGFDIRNGRRSSFLVLGGYEGHASRSGWFGRFGLLLEI